MKGFCARYGVRRVRGCEVYEVRDQGGNILNDPAAAARQQVCMGVYVCRYVYILIYMCVNWGVYVLFDYDGVGGWID